MKHKKIILGIICLLTLILIGIIVVLLLNNKTIRIKEVINTTSGSLNSRDIFAPKSMILKNYGDYLEYTNVNRLETKLTPSNFKDNSYIIVNAEYSSCSSRIDKPVKIKEDDTSFTITINNISICSDSDDCRFRDYRSYLLKTDKIKEDKEILLEYNEIRDECDYNDVVEKKPVIYLYPEKEMNVSIKLLNSKDLITSYPKYDKEWNVVATPSGKLIYNNKEYYSLFYETKVRSIKKHNSGFVVNKKDLASFLEEKLTILGLNYREREEFIIYWLPELEKSNYNYIYFETNANDIYPIEVNPKPDTELRIIMEYIPLKEKESIKGQELKTINRQGFTLVEWGGVLISN